MNDLDPIAVVQQMVWMAAAWDDFTIDLHRHPALAKADLVEQGTDAGAIGHRAGFAIDLDLHGNHCTVPALRPRRVLAHNSVIAGVAQWQSCCFPSN